MPTNKRKTLPSMEELLAQIPETGITRGECNFEDGEYLASHPDTWTPLVLPSRGRPKRGQDPRSLAKSFRLPEEAWALAVQKAERLHLPLHAAVRKAILDWAMAPDQVPAPVPQFVLVMAPQEGGKPWATASPLEIPGQPDNLHAFGSIQ